MMKHVFALVSALMSVSAQAGEISDMLRGKGPVSQDDVVVAPYWESPKDHGISEIGIEHSCPWHLCPEYSFIARSDGTFSYTGEYNMEHLGTRTGTISKRDFAMLADVIHSSDFMRLHSLYATDVLHAGRTTTMVVKNGERKLVTSQAAAGPSILWVIELGMDRLLAESDWQ